MPNLRSQEVSEKGIRMIASDGREFFMSIGQIKKRYDDTLAAKSIAAEMKLQAVAPAPQPTPDKSLALLLAATILVLTVTAISVGYWPVLAVALAASIASAFVLRRQSQAVSPVISAALDPKPLPEVEAKAETTVWLKSSIVAALGSEQISLASIVADFREADGVPTQLEIG